MLTPTITIFQLPVLIRYTGGKGEYISYPNFQLKILPRISNILRILFTKLFICKGLK